MACSAIGRSSRPIVDTSIACQRPSACSSVESLFSWALRDIDKPCSEASRPAVARRIPHADVSPTMAVAATSRIAGAGSSFAIRKTIATMTKPTNSAAMLPIAKLRPWETRSRNPRSQGGRSSPEKIPIHAERAAGAITSSASARVSQFSIRASTGGSVLPFSIDQPNRYSAAARIAKPTSSTAKMNSGSRESLRRSRAPATALPETTASPMPRTIGTSPLEVTTRALNHAVPTSRWRVDGRLEPCGHRHCRHPLLPCTLICGDRVVLLQRERDVVQAAEKAVADLVVDLKRNLTPGEGNLLLAQVDLAVAGASERFAVLVGENDRQQPDLGAVGVEDVREGWRDDRLEAVVL